MTEPLVGIGDASDPITFTAGAHAADGVEMIDAEAVKLFVREKLVQSLGAERAAKIQIGVAAGEYDVSISLTNPDGGTQVARQHSGGLLLTPKTMANLRPHVRSTVQKILDEMGLLKVK
jgi:hypothetical protein